MTDDIQKVREAYEAAMEEAMGYCGDGPKYGEYYRNAFIQALAKRLQPRPGPEKKVWQASPAVALKFATVWDRHSREAGVLADYRKPIDAIAPDIIRERPDLVAAEWERRYRAAYGMGENLVIGARADLFPELDP